ncbi:MAG TPA: SDR family oxidoreductase [Terriglobales bacterium]|nr:SDR family oxidoreductase [Terriglobales bacterium]
MTSKIAVVTGASSGIGLLSTVELAKDGFFVVATMRDPGRRQHLDDAAKAAGVQEKIEVRQLDVTKFASLPEAVSGIVRDYQRIDVLLNNAGFAMSGFAEDMRLEEIRQQFETNFFGHVAMTQAVLPVMRKQRSGHIIMVSSISGLVAQPVVSSYSASKFALEGWSEALRIETRSLGIRVALVEPGAFKTDIWDRNVRIGSFALSPQSPNHDRARRFAAWVQKDVPKADARAVACLIADIASDPNPRLRYRIGRDAAVQYWLRKLLPWKTYEKMIAKTVHID